MKVNSAEHKRVFVLFIVFSLWVLFICVWLVKLQIFDYSKNVNRIEAQSNRTFTMSAKRGTIYDRNGEVMAISVKAKSAFINNKNNLQSIHLLKKAATRVRFTRTELKRIKARIRKGEKFVWLKRKLSETEYAFLAKLKERKENSEMLDFLEEYKRVYPQKSTACHILGGVGIDEQGLYGIEYSMEKTIKGHGGKARVLRDARRKIFDLTYITEPEPGKDVHLTIDASIQFFVEKELKKTVQQYKARGGTVIVMDAREGEVLAMANYPIYEPARVKYTSRHLMRNRAISSVYHPGSTFKVILASIALEKNVCYPQQEFNCYNGVYKIKGETIYDVHHYSKLTFEGVIINSSNIGAARIGEKLGKARYFEGINMFGFGRPMGLRLPAEERGLLHPVNTWSGVSVAYLAHGYEIAVTAMQMTRAFNTLASGGYLLTPSIVKKIDGVFTEKKERTRILSPGTVHRMRSIMTEVVANGTGKKTRIEGLRIAGKTGTTKKISRDKTRRKYIASFGGFFPAENPKITMFVVIDEPKGLFYGGDVAAPLYKSIAERLAIYLKVFPELDKRNEIRI